MASRPSSPTTTSQRIPPRASSRPAREASRTPTTANHRLAVLHLLVLLPHNHPTVLRLPHSLPTAALPLLPSRRTVLLPHLSLPTVDHHPLNPHTALPLVNRHTVPLTTHTALLSRTPMELPRPASTPTAPLQASSPPTELPQATTTVPLPLLPSVSPPAHLPARPAGPPSTTRVHSAGTTSSTPPAAPPGRPLVRLPSAATAPSLITRLAPTAPSNRLLRARTPLARQRRTRRTAVPTSGCMVPVAPRRARLVVHC